MQLVTYMEYNYKTTSIPDHFLYSISEKDCTISKPLFVAESACFPQFPQIYLNLLTQGVLHRNHHHDLGARLLVSFSPQAKLLASRTASSSLISSVFSSSPLAADQQLS